MFNAYSCTPYVHLYCPLGIHFIFPVKITNNGTAVFILRLQLHRRYYYSQEISLAGLLTHDNNNGVFPAAVTILTSSQTLAEKNVYRQ